MNSLRPKSVLEFDDCKLKRAEKTNSLYVIIDEELNWNDQYKSVSVKFAGLHSKLGDLYHALVESHVRESHVR